DLAIGILDQLMRLVDLAGIARTGLFLRRQLGQVIEISRIILLEGHRILAVRRGPAETGGFALIDLPHRRLAFRLRIGAIGAVGAGEGLLGCCGEYPRGGRPARRPLPPPHRRPERHDWQAVSPALASDPDLAMPDPVMPGFASGPGMRP